MQEKDYGSAWDLAIDNRVDLNVLVDYCWPAFLEDAPQFVQQVPGDQDQADLLASLRPGSTATGDGLYGGLLHSAGTDSIQVCHWPINISVFHGEADRSAWVCHGINTRLSDTCPESSAMCAC